MSWSTQYEMSVLCDEWCQMSAVWWVVVCVAGYEMSVLCDEWCQMSAVWWVALCDEWCQMSAVWWVVVCVCVMWEAKTRQRGGGRSGGGAAGAAGAKRKTRTPQSDVGNKNPHTVMWGKKLKRMDPFLLRLLWSIPFWLSFLLWWHSVYWMLQYGEPYSSYDSVFFELNLEVTPRMLWREMSEMSHLEEIALNPWWKKVPLPREEKIQNMSLCNQLNKMLRDQTGMLGNQIQNQKAQDQQVHNLPASQLHWLPCEYMTHRCQTMKQSGEIEQEEELTQALPSDPLPGPLQPQTLRHRDPTPALPELPFKVITTG